MKRGTARSIGKPLFGRNRDGLLLIRGDYARAVLRKRKMSIIKQFGYNWKTKDISKPVLSIRLGKNW